MPPGYVINKWVVQESLETRMYTLKQCVSLENSSPRENCWALSQRPQGLPSRGCGAATVLSGRKSVSKKPLQQKATLHLGMICYYGMYIMDSFYFASSPCLSTKSNGQINYITSAVDGRLPPNLKEQYAN